MSKIKTRRLHATFEGRLIGTIETSERGLRFAYDGAWLGAEERFPISLSLPLVAGESIGERVENVLWNLLPDNEITLARWASRFRVSARDVVGLLAQVGEDCAGAVQYVREERIPHVRPTETTPDIRAIDRAEIGARLREVRADVGAWRRAGDVGQFSLAGAQPKIALFRRGDVWAVPAGRTPTTHILKPPLADLASHAWNEHLTLNLARAIGIPAARSEVLVFDGEQAIVVERYDRLDTGGAVARIHQEDFAQALGVHPARKYEAHGGPGVEAILRVLQAHSSRRERDVAAFVDACAFSYWMLGTDAHAKNYSLLHAPGNIVRLAPLYDAASFHPYDHSHAARGIALAMGIGGERRVRYIRPRHFERLAGWAGIDAAELSTRVRAMRDKLIAAIEATIRTASVEEVRTLAELFRDRIVRMPGMGET